MEDASMGSAEPVEDASIGSATTIAPTEVDNMNGQYVIVPQVGMSSKSEND
uniref:Uncharacterized protein n=2 Tax=Oryza sativa subsp. japonica TaxID=39947 RepID=Q53LK7_ORYSJ|nr:hypothetical protein LOC_Os11g09870 [Oryza sativa Japonica Group]ABA91977.1 hypothetical protein LOC_Os11g09870 [Oryza sativa Japonica Group]